MSAVPEGALERDLQATARAAIDSLVELLQGRLSQGRHGAHLPAEDRPVPGAGGDHVQTAAAPTGPTMCKHVAAVLYGVGARLDERPELLFALRKVDQKDLIATAGAGLPLARKAPAAGRVLRERALRDLRHRVRGRVDSAAQGRPPLAVRVAHPGAEDTARVQATSRSPAQVRP